jgi:hypothetical protein
VSGRAERAASSGQRTWNVESTVESGTSPVWFIQPYIAKSAVPFLNWKRTTGSGDPLRTSSTTADA